MTVERVAPSFTCPKCGRTSHNLNDVRERYCGACHEWFSDDRSSIPVEAAALCLNEFVVFAKQLGRCPRCGSHAWISLNFYIPHAAGRAAAPPP